MTDHIVRKPLVATLVITPSGQQYFNELRREHFPPERNYLNAHLTLFHALPDEPWLFEELETMAADQLPLEALVHSIVSLGNGTAFKITSVELALLHQRLQKKWGEFLTNQDKQKRNFHITVQNKVDAQEARQLKAVLEKDFKPFPLTIHGIQLWRYHGGPWEYLRSLNFRENAVG